MIDEHDAPSFISERAQMEKERLLRLGSGLRSPYSPDAGPSKSQESRPLKRAPTPSSSSRESSVDPEGQGSTFFWHGELRHTLSPQSSNPTALSFHDILGDKSDLQLLIASARTIDHAWLSSVIPQTLPAILAVNPFRDGALGQKAVDPSVSFLGPSWVRCCPGMDDGPGVMNARFMLLFYRSGRLRVAVTTANIVEHDWTYIENMVWVQDLPLSPADTVSKSSSSLGSKFFQTIIELLSELNVTAGLHSLSMPSGGVSLPFASLENLFAPYDFSAIQVAIVRSSPGKHEGWPKVISQGHTSLMSAIKNVGAQCPRNGIVNIEYLSTSIDNYSAEWLRQFQLSAEGGEGHQAWMKKTSKARRETPFPAHERFKVLFPTIKTFKALTKEAYLPHDLSFPSIAWNNPRFPRYLLHDVTPQRGRVLLHSKMIIGSFQVQQTVGGPNNPVLDGETGETENSGIGGWCYVGSHDLTTAGWGEWTPTGSWFSPILAIKNFELGVVFSLPLEIVKQPVSQVACFRRPPRPYSKDDTPWMPGAS